MFDLAAVQKALQELGLDGWLLYDFRGLNASARRVLGMSPEPHDVAPLVLLRSRARRTAQTGPSHRIRCPRRLSRLEGDLPVRWQELKPASARWCRDLCRIAMEYVPQRQSIRVASRCRDDRTGAFLRR